MTDEERTLFDSYRLECEHAWKVAQRLDAFHPQTPGSFTGNPSERIERQLRHLGITGFRDELVKG